MGSNLISLQGWWQTSMPFRILGDISTGLELMSGMLSRNEGFSLDIPPIGEGKTQDQAPSFLTKVVVKSKLHKDLKGEELDHRTFSQDSAPCI